MTPLGSLLAAWLMFQIASGVVTTFATLYMLFSLGKSAAALDRLATSFETMAERSAAPPSLPGAGQFPGGGYPAPQQAQVQPQPMQPQYAPAPIPGMAPPVGGSVGTVVPSSPPTASGEMPTGASDSSSNVPYVPRREVTP